MQKYLSSQKKQRCKIAEGLKKRQASYADAYRGCLWHTDQTFRLELQLYHSFEGRWIQMLKLQSKLPSVSDNIITVFLYQHASQYSKNWTDELCWWLEHSKRFLFKLYSRPWRRLQAETHRLNIRVVLYAASAAGALCTLEVGEVVLEASTALLQTQPGV